MKIILLFAILMTGCSHLTLVKQCAKVEGDSDKFVCRTVKPWE